MAEEIGNIPRDAWVRMVIGSNIKKLRKKHMMTQVELANCTGINRTTIAKIETYKQAITLITLLTIAKALEESPDELLKGWEHYF